MDNIENNLMVLAQYVFPMEKWEDSFRRMLSGIPWSVGPIMDECQSYSNLNIGRDYKNKEETEG